jgi:hypothetical protein
MILIEEHNEHEKKTDPNASKESLEYLSAAPDSPISNDF